MEISIKNTLNDTLKKEFDITISKSVINDKLNESIKKIQKDLKLDGFRKGHVPTEVIKQKYGKSISAEETDKLINKAVSDIISNEKLKLALSPKIDLKDYNYENDVNLKVTFELYPELPEIQLDKIKVVKREAEIKDDDLKESFDKFIKNFAGWDEVADAKAKAKKGNSVDIDYVGKIDNEEFEGGSAKNYRLELGSKSFIDDFEDQLVGKRAGDEVKVKVKFPANYHNPKFSEKAAIFEVKINKILEINLPEINDQFIKEKVNIETVDDLKVELKKQLEENYSSISQNLFKKELFDYLDKKYDFKLPEGLVDEQFQGLWSGIEEELKVNPDKFSNTKEKEKEKAKKRELAERMIRCGMILNEISIKSDVKITDEDINKEFMKIVSRFPGQEKLVIEYYQKNPSLINQLKGSLLENKVIDYILSKDSIEKKSISTKDLDKLWNKANQE